MCADFDRDPLEAIAPEAEPGMNLISVDFDLVMVNRPNERLYGKPMVALLGNKCYREFEKRDEPCPHCPGRLALATGRPHEAETVGVRDDGTRFAARIRAHPVIGPGNQPTGFIEVVEDITEQKRAESLAAIDADLQSALAAVQNISHALRETLRAALRVEGIDIGAVYRIDQSTRRHELVHAQGMPPGLVHRLAEVSEGAPLQAQDQGSEGLRALAVVPILHRGRAVATLLAGTATYPDIPASLRAGLQALGATTGNAIARILAERCRGDAIADLEALIAVSPVATWVLDGRGRITVWNRAAERTFGWRAAEVVDRAPPWAEGAGFIGADLPAPRAGYETTLFRKDGTPVPVRLSTAPFRDVVGDDSTVVFMAQDLSDEQRLAQLERELSRRSQETAPAEPGGPAGAAPAGARVLIIDAGETWGGELSAVLSELGHSPVRCASTEQATLLLSEAGPAEAGRPDPDFSLAVVALVSPDGSSGLDLTAALRSSGWRIPVAMSSEVDVQGHEQHGIAAIIRRPYRPDAVARVVRAAMTAVGPTR